MMQLNHFRRLSASALAVAALVALTACSSGSGSSTSSTVDTSTLKAATAALSGYQSGVLDTPPTTGPKPDPGKNVWILSCGEASPACAAISAASKAAGELIGWHTTVCDGKLNQNDMAACVRSAIAAHADALISVSVDCAAIQQPLADAKAAGVKTIAALAFDCDQIGSQKLFTQSVVYHEKFPTLTQLAKGIAKARADWVISATGAKARAISLFASSSAITRIQATEFADVLKTCSSCSIAETVEYSDSDLGGGQVRPKFESALLRHPDANAVATPADTFFLLGLQAAITDSGRGNELHSIGGEGNPQNMQFIASGGGENATVATPNEWMGFAAIDTANRVLAGSKAASEGIAFQLVDKSNVNVVYSSGAYTPPVDFKKAYETAWGLR